MKLTFEAKGLDQAVRLMAEGLSPRRLNAAMATALTRTALEVRDAVKTEMRAVFDRPTPYTMNSLFVRPATAQRLAADVYFKDDRAGSGTPATKYLLPQVEGGSRGAKGLEVALRAVGVLPAGWFVVPGAGARLDAYGNVSRGQIIQVLSQLRITLVAGATRNLPFDARKQIAAQRKAGGRFFVIKPGAKGAAPGVYQREFGVQGSARGGDVGVGSRNITPVFIFVRKASYRTRLDFDRITRATAAAKLPGHLRRAVQDQLDRASAKGTA